MAVFTYIRGLGLWVADSDIMPDELEEIERRWPLILHSEGGTWEPEAPIILTGDGDGAGYSLRVDEFYAGNAAVSGNLGVTGEFGALDDAQFGGDVEVAGNLDVGDDSSVDGALDVTGDITCDDLIVLDDVTVADDVNAGGDVNSVGDINAGGDVNVGGEVKAPSFVYNDDQGVSWIRVAPCEMHGDFSFVVANATVSDSQSSAGAKIEYIPFHVPAGAVITKLKLALTNEGTEASIDSVSFIEQRGDFSQTVLATTDISHTGGSDAVRSLTINHNDAQSSTEPTTTAAIRFYMAKYEWHYDATAGGSQDCVISGAMLGYYMPDSSELKLPT